MTPECKYGRHTYKQVTVLAIACLNNQAEEVENLVARCGANPNHNCSRANRHRRRPDLTGMTPLLIAAENGHVRVCRMLVEHHGCCPNTAANNGFTPVFTASQFGHLEVVKLLAELVADLENLEIFTTYKTQTQDNFGTKCYAQYKQAISV